MYCMSFKCSSSSDRERQGDRSSLLDKRFVDSPHDDRALVAASAEAALTQIDHGPDCSGVAETAIDHK